MTELGWIICGAMLCTIIGFTLLAEIGDWLRREGIIQ